jgi:hypothetical protein
MQRERGWRRWQLEKRKKKWKSIMRNGWGWNHELDEDPRYIGMRAATPQACSCPGCGHRRRWYGPTVQERRQLENV